VKLALNDLTEVPVSHPGPPVANRPQAVSACQSIVPYVSPASPKAQAPGVATRGAITCFKSQFADVCARLIVLSSAWSNRFIFVVVLFTVWPGLGMYVGAFMAHIVQGLLTRWLMACEMLIQGFQDSINTFFQGTYYKWSFWLANGRWPQVVPVNGTSSFPVEQGVETPNTVSFLFGFALLYVLSCVKKLF
jgi:hypothetical protein